MLSVINYYGYARVRATGRWVVAEGRVLLAMVALLFLLPAKAQMVQDQYVRKEAMIPMRDGVHLYTVIFLPKQLAGPFPFLLCRTPYGVSPYPSPEKNHFLAELARDGYLFVFQDIRGRHHSEGTFEMFRPLRLQGQVHAVDESTDCYDTIDWLLKNISGNNGRVGIYGGSYDGWEACMAAIDPHPALVAVSPQAPFSDFFLGDDFHHNGAFRLSYSLEYTFSLESSRGDSLLPLLGKDTYAWYLQLGPLSRVNKHYFFHGVPTWNKFEAHPNYDAFWKRRALAPLLDSPRVNILTVAGWWDAEDFYGPLSVYTCWERKDRHDRNFLVIGPWNHGGWAYGTGKKLGPLDFGSLTAITFRKNIQAPWFAYYLKGRGDGHFADATIFQTGSNMWKSYGHWPPRESVHQALYVAAGHRLSFDKPLAGQPAYDQYTSDPAHPVPYRSHPIEPTYGAGSRWAVWQAEDQRFLQDRTDVLSWQSDTLSSDLTVTGNIGVNLYASTTGTDADWVVKLIDVYPKESHDEPAMGGYELMVAAEVVRGRFRKSFEHPSPLKVGAVLPYYIDLHTLDHVFKKGHRIGLQVQSSWFPLIDRNPQRYVPNIFKASPSDFIKARQRIYHSPHYPSCVQLSVVPQN